MSAERLVVVGGGPAGLEAARAYRRARARDEVVLVSADEHLPYNRPPLSKDFLRGDSEEDSLPLEDEDFYPEHDIEVRLRTRAQGIDTERRLITLSGRDELAYSSCILTTGASPKRLPVPGADRPRVGYLRSREDGRQLRRVAAGARSAVVVGSGFIGCEVAASLVRRGLAVTLLSAESAPQSARLGDAIAGQLQRWLENDGVKLRMSVDVEEIEPSGRVRLADGSSASGDLVLVAGGVEPEAAIAKQAGLTIERDRVQVDAQMRSSHPSVLAAGDVAFAFNAAAGRHLSVEHWGDAVAMGNIAGQTAAGAEMTWVDVPGFWSTIGDRTLKYAAWGDGFDDPRFVDHGNGAFTAWYEREGITVGVLTHDADDDYQQGQLLVQKHQPLPETA